MSENIVGTKQAAEMLGVSISTIYRMVDHGILMPSKTPGGQRRFPVSQLEEYKQNSRAIVAPQNPYQMKLDIDSGEIVEDMCGHFRPLRENCFKMKKRHILPKNQNL